MVKRREAPSTQAEAQSFEGLEAQLSAFIEATEKAFEDCREIQALNEARVQALGKKSWLTETLRELKGAEAKLKVQNIPLIQQARERLERAFQSKNLEYTEKELQLQLERESFDTALPALSSRWQGSKKHPISSVLQDLVDYFRQAGFEVAEGPEIESRYHNFDALNFPSGHPALAPKDSFWLNPEYLLRTHTSGVQVRVMQREKPPFRMISPGRVFRPDSDTTHTPMFHQLEGLVIDEKVQFSHLKWTLERFLHDFFEGTELKIRFRPSYFPFTSPSGEVDIQLPGRNKWIEILGCGMVHPHVLRGCDIDPEQYQGFAFGMGVERLTMLRYQLEDLKSLFENDLRFLAQFP